MIMFTKLFYRYNFKKLTVTVAKKDFSIITICWGSFIVIKVKY